MTTGSAPQRPAPAHIDLKESHAERTVRLRREAAVIAKAHADIDAGLGVENECLEAWFDRLDHDDTTPPPIALSPTHHR